MAAAGLRRRLNIPVISWSIEFRPDKPSENMGGRQSRDRAYNMRGDNAVAGRDSKAQPGVVREGMGRDEPAPVAAYVDGVAVAAENRQWILDLDG